MFANHIVVGPDRNDAPILDRDRFGYWLLIVNCDDVTVGVDGIGVTGHVDPLLIAVILLRPRTTRATSVASSAQRSRPTMLWHKALPGRQPRPETPPTLGETVHPQLSLELAVNLGPARRKDENPS